MQAGDAIINQSRPFGLDDLQNDKLLMNYWTRYYYMTGIAQSYIAPLAVSDFRIHTVNP